jgi:DNA-binding response OmpR family regulator
MHGLTHRYANRQPTDAVPTGAAATVLVIDCDPLTLPQVRQATDDHFRIITAADGVQALAMIDEHHPDIVMIDMTLPSDEIATVTMGVVARNEFDAMPVIMMDPEQLQNSVSVRGRIDEALDVIQRVYMGGGLRNRTAE